MVSALAGWTRALFSLHRAAAVYCTSMKPLFRPPSAVKKGGSTCPLLSASSRRLRRRSAMLPSSVKARPR